jgi:chemotaxis protein MotB
MAKKKKCKCPEGVPEWIVTFGDMMSLLLTFFILLAAFSELKKPREFQDLLQSLQVAFGLTGGGGTTPTNEAPFRSLPRILENMRLQPLMQPSQQKIPTLSKSPKPNKPRLQEGDRFVLSAPIQFAEGVFKVEIEQENKIQFAAGELRGKNHKVEIRGHADRSDLETEDFKEEQRKNKLSAAAYLLDLSFKRANAVADYLIDNQGVARNRIRIMALANHEPQNRSTTLENAAGNRRVDIIQTEKLVQDFQPND